jgi:3-phosphoshikimate 1-carboxyvinyltransferase
MTYLDLGPVASVGGAVRLPGSKSISNRMLLLAGRAAGETRLRDVLDSDDTRHMLEALRTLGVRCHGEGADCVRIAGVAGRFPVREAELHLGNAGTAFRPLTAVLAVLGGDYRLSGVARMHERPIGDLVDALRGAGAHIDYMAQPGYPPLRTREGTLDLAAPVRVRGNISSQFVTALLIALPLARRECELEIEGELISKPYVEMTLNTLGRFGVNVKRQGWSRFFVPATSGYRSPGEVFVEGDASSASYFLAAGAIGGLRGGGPVRVEGVGGNSIQGDVRFTETLERMGARITLGENWIEATAGEEARRRGKLRALDADLNHIPDAAMTAAVAALFADGPSTLRNIGSWRVKETDLIAAMATELRKFGAGVEEGADYLRITPPPGLPLTPTVSPSTGRGSNTSPASRHPPPGVPLAPTLSPTRGEVASSPAASHLPPPVAVDTYDDHRIAMCFSLVALAGIPVRINDPECVRKTFPQYFDVLASISQ